MKKYELRVYWMTGDTYSTVCLEGLDRGVTWTIEAESSQMAEEMFMGSIDHDFVDSVESDPNFRFWNVVEV